MVNYLSMKKFMEEALKEARKAYDLGEIPVGAVIVYNGDIIGRGHNKVELKKNPMMHGEIIAINEACSTLGNKFLNNCSIYVTLEPCSMCAGAIVLSRIENMYIGAIDKKTGACGGVFNLVDGKFLNHEVKVSYGLLGNECSLLLKKFFKELRDR